MRNIFISIFIVVLLSACAETNDLQQTIQPAQKHFPDAKSNCYDIGFQWGVCAAKNTEDKSCKPGTDAVISEECMNQPITQQGIKDGIRSIQKP